MIVLVEGVMEISSTVMTIDNYWLMPPYKPLDDQLVNFVGFVEISITLVLTAVFSFVWYLAQLVDGHPQSKDGLWIALSILQQQSIKVKVTYSNSRRLLTISLLILALYINNLYGSKMASQLMKPVFHPPIKTFEVR